KTKALRTSHVPPPFVTFTYIDYTTFSPLSSSFDPMNRFHKSTGNGFHCRRMLSAGTASASSLAKFARCGVFRSTRCASASVALVTPEVLACVLYLCVPSGEQDVLVSKLAIDVTDFSRPGVADLRYSHSS